MAGVLEYFLPSQSEEVAHILWTKNSELSDQAFPKAGKKTDAISIVPALRNAQQSLFMLTKDENLHFRVGLPQHNPVLFPGASFVGLVLRLRRPRGLGDRAFQRAEHTQSRWGGSYIWRVLYISFAIAAGEPGLLLLARGLKPAEDFRIEMSAPPEKT